MMRYLYRNHTSFLTLVLVFTQIQQAEEFAKGVGYLTDVGIKNRW
jgi:hypothetical protein